MKSAGRWAACTWRTRRIVSSSAARTSGSSTPTAAAIASAGHPQVHRAHAVEPLGEVAQLGGAARADVREDGRDDLGGVLDVDLGAGQHVEELAARQGATAQVDAGDHVPEYRTDACARPGHDHRAGRALRHSRRRRQMRHDCCHDQVPISDDSIRLGQFLKLADLADSGAHARELLEDGAVTVNGEDETRRGRQLVRGDVVEVDLPAGYKEATVG